MQSFAETCYRTPFDRMSIPEGLSQHDILPPHRQNFFSGREKPCGYKIEYVGKTDEGYGSEFTVTIYRFKSTKDDPEAIKDKIGWSKIKRGEEQRDAFKEELNSLGGTCQEET